MNIALIGYGKMGKAIEKTALARGHTIGLVIDVNNKDYMTCNNLKKVDVAIEFTFPSSAPSNYMMCFEAGIPVVSGTTGWLDRKDEVLNVMERHNGTFFYASNFSLGVNLFFVLNKKLAAMMASLPDYKVSIEEIHHTQKLDAPSGTAITLADDLIDILPGKKTWAVNEGSDLIKINAVREGEVPGIHRIKYESDIDFIMIEHNAKTREGFAFGAVMAAEYCVDKKGFLNMNDLLNL